MITTVHRLTMTLSDYIWGGRKLATKYGKGSRSRRRIAESWENCEKMNDTSVLLKWIDTDLPTSIHVHPSKEMPEKLGYPCENENEIWVIVEAEPEGRIGIGFNRNVTREEVLKALYERTLELLINNIEPQPGDCFVVPPGTIHYIDGGVTLLEVTTKSSTSLRLYDWLRDVTTNRDVHVAESLLAMNFGIHIPIYTRLFDREEPFQVSCDEETIELNWRNMIGEMIWCESSDQRLLTLLTGEGMLNRSEKFHQGETVLVPYDGMSLSVASKCCNLLETKIIKRKKND